MWWLKGGVAAGGDGWGCQVAGKGFSPPSEALAFSVPDCWRPGKALFQISGVWEGFSLRGGVIIGKGKG